MVELYMVQKVAYEDCEKGDHTECNLEISSLATQDFPSPWGWGGMSIVFN